jgi:UDP-N-acetyl-D-glucosamine dehydrogenase
LSKLLENTFRHVNVALVNELAIFAHDLGIDIWETIEIAATKPFGFMSFTPGPGVGGHCLPVDPTYLSWRVRRDLECSFRFIELANDVNSQMPDYVLRRIVAALNCQKRSINGSRVLLLGLAYKRNTGDARGAPAKHLARKLLRMGADVRGVDPHVADEDTEPGVVRVDLTPHELAAADLVVVLTDHDAFDLETAVAHARYIVDTRHCISAPHVEYL